ncbi:MAG: ornithine carbamoyltransferase [Parvularculales bacterium]
MTGEPRHFIDLDVIAKEDLRSILDDARARKENRKGSEGVVKVDTDRPLENYLLAMVFEKSSTRTRVSFDVAMRQLGGETLLLNGVDMHLGRGESLADTARVLSRYVDIIMFRSASHDNLEELAVSAEVPVINGLTNRSHPCQIMADVMTFEEHKGPIEGCKIAWVGDGNNVAASWIHAAAQFNFELVLACPTSLSPDVAVLKKAQAAGGQVTLTHEPYEAVAGAECVVADTWVSMTDSEDTKTQRHAVLTPFQVDESLMAAAGGEAIFMHCLPAHRGEEVTASVIDGPQSVVWDEAENRLHVQKSILRWCLL